MCIRDSGYEDACFTETDEEILRAFVETQTHERFAGITWPRLLAEGFCRLNLPDPHLPFAQGNFPTPSGKCEFYSARMAADGYDPLPSYTPPQWQEQARQGEGEKGGEEARSLAIGNTSPLAPRPSPLVCISPPVHSFLNTTFANAPRFIEREGEPVLRIHPEDAAARGIEEGSQDVYKRQLLQWHARLFTRRRHGDALFRAHGREPAGAHDLLRSWL